jgi:hypothetical protein
VLWPELVSLLIHWVDLGFSIWLLVHDRSGLFLPVLSFRFMVLQALFIFFWFSQGQQAGCDQQRWFEAEEQLLHAC